jgi:hypothetical protein
MARDTPPSEPFDSLSEVTTEPIYRLQGHQRLMSDEPLREGDEFDFDRILQGMKEDLGETSGTTPEAPSPISVLETTAPVEPLQQEAPSHIIRRAIQEFESGSLDELLIHQLLEFDRNSAEFRQGYVRLRVQSLMRPRASNTPTPYSTAPASLARSETEIQEQHGHNPWRVDRLRDLWSFFGPWLSLLVVIQLYASHATGHLVTESWKLLSSTSPHLIAVIVAAGLVGLSAFLLQRLRGRDFHDFSPRLLQISAASGVCAIAAHVARSVF